MIPLARFSIFFSFMLPSTSAFAVSNSASSSCDIAVVGCGVLGTSLCRQLLSSPDFESKTGE